MITLLGSGVFAVLLLLQEGVMSTKLGLIKKPADYEPKPSNYGTRPRGVSYIRGPLYATGDQFQCIDGSKTIPFAHVNDDYCDCADGSDEPGTSACPNALFHCLNRGYKATDLPSSRVNDQICDCCDGSDEWDSAVDCPDICPEMGAKWREETHRRAAVAQKGFIKRGELAAEGQKLKAEKEKGIDGLRKEKEALTPQRDEAEAKKRDAEDKERDAREKHRLAWEEVRKEKKKEKALVLFKKFDTNDDGRITIDELKKFSEFDADNNGEVTDEEAKIYLIGRDDADLDYFVDSVFDTIKMLFIERAAPATATPEEEPKVEEKKEEVERKEDEEKKEVPPGVEESGEGEGEKPEEEQDGEDEKSGSEEDDKEDNPPPPTRSPEDEMPPYDDETNKLLQEAVELRKVYSEIDDRMRSLEDSIRESEAFLNGDYGEDAAWAPLKGKCVEMEENQYTYKLCLFDKAIQKERGAHSETSLGTWGEWTGGEKNKYAEQKYKNGQQCWNGPERSTTVVTECGEETELVEASEPSKCEYKFVLRSPAACPDPATIVDDHDEL